MANDILPEGFPDDAKRAKENRRLFKAVDNGDADDSVHALADIFRSRGLKASKNVIESIPTAPE